MNQPSLSVAGRPSNRRPLARAWRASLLLAAALSCSVGVQAANDAATVLKGNKVTESNLLDALTPAPEDVTTRSLRVTRDGAPAVPPRKASASLLITFETNSAQLTSAAKQQLSVVAAALKNNRLAEYSFSVEGHADPRGTAETNLTLSQQRADSVREYLVSAHGIAPERLQAQGKGDLELLNRKVPAAAENRRVTIVTNTK